MSRHGENSKGKSLLTRWTNVREVMEQGGYITTSNSTNGAQVSSSLLVTPPRD